jgi:hypothetical protein
MYSDTGDTTSLVPGFPIRTSSDPRSVGSSPRHIAASHVLHRLLMPRHPPCALKHLQTQENNSNKNATKNSNLFKDARNHYPIKQTPHPTTKMERHHLTRPNGQDNTGVASGPNSVPAELLSQKKGRKLLRTKPTPTTGNRFLTAHTPTNWGCISWCSLERR